MLLQDFSLIFVLFTVTVKTSLSLLTAKDQEFSSILYKTVFKTVDTCLKDKFNPLIMDKETSNYLKNIIDDREYSSIIVIDEYFKINHSLDLNPKRAIFILSTQFGEKFNIYSLKFKATPWYNTESFFILIGPSNDSCIDAEYLLTTAWDRKILSIVYFCYESTENNQLMLYTFNPFTNQAPGPWKFFKSINKLDHAWTLYNQAYYDGKIICSNLVFDKTKHMAGYQLKVGTQSYLENTTIDSKSFLAMKTLPFNALIPSVLTALNVTIIIYSNESARLIDGVMNEGLEKLWKGDYDIYLDERPIQIMYNHITDVLITSDIVIITQKRPYLKVEEKILLFFHLHASALIIMTIIVSIIVLKMYRNQKFIVALLEILSLFIGTGIRQPLNGVPIRIYLFGIFWLAIILNGTFQGNLAYFLTKPERISVETVHDLKKLDYQIYGTETWLAVHQWRFSSLHPSRIHNLPNSSYNSWTTNRPRVALVGPASQLYKIAQKNKLHLSLPIGSVYAVWWTSANFLLKKKMNLVISSCRESGLIDLWNTKGYLNTREHLVAEELNETRGCIRSVGIHDLFFAFKLWILGLGCSAVTFMIEIGQQLWLKRK